MNNLSVAQQSRLNRINVILKACHESPKRLNDIVKLLYVDQSAIIRDIKILVEMDIIQKTPIISNRVFAYSSEISSVSVDLFRFIMKNSAKKVSVFDKDEEPQHQEGYIEGARHYAMRHVKVPLKSHPVSIGSGINLF